MFKLEPNLKLLFAMFFTTFGTYSLNKLTDKDEDLINLPERANYVIGNERFLLFISVVSYSITILLGFSVNISTVVVLLFPLFAGIIYSVDILPIPRIKKIIGMKNIFAALSWTIVIIFLPVIYSYESATITILIFFFIFIKLIVNAVIFDIRDIEGDSKSNIKTIPVAIGKEKTRKMLLVIHSSLIPWLAVSIYWGFFTNYLPVLIFCILYGYWYINYFCKSEKVPKFATDLLVDGEWLFVAALCFIINII